MSVSVGIGRIASACGGICALLAAACVGVPVAQAADNGSGLAGLLGTSEVQIAAGGIAVVMPRYEGSKQYHVVGVPFLAPGGPESDKDRFHFKGADDLRVRLLDIQNLEFGALGGWRFGRHEDDSHHLIGLGAIDGGLILGGYVAYHMGPLMPFVSYHHQVTGSTTGGVLRFGTEAKAQVLPWLKLTAIGGASWADDDYMTSFFGVTAAQSAASGLTRFDTGAGIKDAFVELGSEFRIDAAWKLKLSGRYTRLVGDAAASPVTESADQFTGMVTITYDFRLPLP